MLLRRMGTNLVMDGERKVHKIKWGLCAKIDYGGNQMVAGVKEQMKPRILARIRRLGRQTCHGV